MDSRAKQTSESEREKRKQSPQTMGTFWEFTRWILVYLLNWIELTMQRVYKNAKVRNRDEVRQWQRIDRKCEKIDRLKGKAVKNKWHKQCRFCDFFGKNPSTIHKCSSSQAIENGIWSSCVGTVRHCMRFWAQLLHGKLEKIVKRKSTQIRWWKFCFWIISTVSECVSHGFRQHQIE